LCSAIKCVMSPSDRCSVSLCSDPTINTLSDSVACPFFNRMTLSRAY